MKKDVKTDVKADMKTDPKTEKAEKAEKKEKKQKKPRKKREHTPLWQNPRLRYGGFSIFIICVLIGGLIALNFAMTALEKKNGWRVDFSFNAVTTQSATTVNILSQLEHDVHIYALYTKGSEDAQLLELLDRYAAVSDRITWEQTDASLNPGLLTKFRGTSSDETVSNDSIIVYCEDTDRWRILSPIDFVSLSLNYDEGQYEIAGLTYESELTSAIVYVTRETIPRVCILQGHGELDESGTETLKTLLENNNFSVEYISLLDSDTELTSDDLLMILSPVRDLMDTELTKITEFIGKGGNILFTCDYTDPIEDMPNYSALLRSFGINPLTGIVVASEDEPDTYYNNVRIDLIPTMQSTDMTLELVQSNADTLLLTGSRAFETPEESDQNLDVSVLLTSGYKAYLRDLSNGNLSLTQADDDAIGPFALALQCRRVTTDGYISKAVVLGCSTLLTSSQVQSMTDAQEFIVTVVQYLASGTAIDLGIVAKTAVRPQLSVQATTLGSVILVTLPLIVVAIAVAVLLPRRRK